MSYWDHPKPVRRVRSVDADDIARESCALLDSGGVTALTIRAVAGRLSVSPPSLYSRLDSADDLLDLALDFALDHDRDVGRAAATTDLHELMLTFYRHLRRHPWATWVIGLRAPRGPAYLHLSERICALLVDQGSPDPLTVSYAMSNFVIGSATTAPMAPDERRSTVDSAAAPTYSRLHAEHPVDAEAIVSAGLIALRGVDAVADSG